MSRRAPVQASDTDLVAQVVQCVLAPWAARRAAYLLHLAIAAPAPCVPSDDLRTRLRSALGSLNGSYINPSSLRRDMIHSALEVHPYLLRHRPRRPHRTRRPHHPLPSPLVHPQRLRRHRHLATASAAAQIALDDLHLAHSAQASAISADAAAASALFTAQDHALRVNAHAATTAASFASGAALSTSFALPTSSTLAASTAHSPRLCVIFLAVLLALDDKRIMGISYLT